jgi:hypothetical protein
MFEEITVINKQHLEKWVRDQMFECVMKMSSNKGDLFSKYESLAYFEMLNMLRCDALLNVDINPDVYNLVMSVSAMKRHVFEIKSIDNSDFFSKLVELRQSVKST